MYGRVNVWQGGLDGWIDETERVQQDEVGDANRQVGKSRERAIGRRVAKCRVQRAECRMQDGMTARGNRAHRTDGTDETHSRCSAPRPDQTLELDQS